LATRQRASWQHPLVDVVALATLSGLILIKEMGVPVPVPGDLLVLGAGAATSGRPEAVIWLLAILLAGYAGGSVQFGLVRGALRRPFLALLGRFGVSEARIESLAAGLQSGGVRAVAIARATPGLRVGVIASSALAALPARQFLPGLVAGNSVFVGGHFALGFVLGRPALGVAAELGSPAALAAILIVLAVVGLVAWLVIGRRPARAAAEKPVAAVASWVDAACPICLTIAAIRTVAPAGVDDLAAS
jgi:membrane protein DedA with SNARE-associated domain